MQNLSVVDHQKESADVDIFSLLQENNTPDSYVQDSSSDSSSPQHSLVVDSNFGQFDNTMYMPSFGQLEQQDLIQDPFEFNPGLNGFSNFVTPLQHDLKSVHIQPTSIVVKTDDSATKKDIKKVKKPYKTKDRSEIWRQKREERERELQKLKEKKTFSNEQEEKEWKKKRRMIRNRLSAQASREKRKHLIEALERENNSLRQNNDSLKMEVVKLSAMNQKLRDEMEKLKQKLREYELPNKFIRDDPISFPTELPRSSTDTPIDFGGHNNGRAISIDSTLGYNGGDTKPERISKTQKVIFLFAFLFTIGLFVNVNFGPGNVTSPTKLHFSPPKVQFEREYKSIGRTLKGETISKELIPKEPPLKRSRAFGQSKPESVDKCKAKLGLAPGLKKEPFYLKRQVKDWIFKDTLHVQPLEPENKTRDSNNTEDIVTLDEPIGDLSLVDNTKVKDYPSMEFPRMNSGNSDLWEKGYMYHSTKEEKDTTTVNFICPVLYPLLGPPSNQQQTPNKKNIRLSIFVPVHAMGNKTSKEGVKQVDGQPMVQFLKLTTGLISTSDAYLSTE